MSRRNRVIAQIYAETEKAHNVHASIKELTHIWQSNAKFPGLQIDRNKDLMAELYGPRHTLKIPNFRATIHLLQGVLK